MFASSHLAGPMPSLFFGGRQISDLLLHQRRSVPAIRCSRCRSTRRWKAAKPSREHYKAQRTCGYFFPAGDRIPVFFYARGDSDCPPRPDYSHGYVWPIYSTYNIYTAKPMAAIWRRLTNHVRATMRNPPSASTANRYLHVDAQRRPRHLHDERRRKQRSQLTHALYDGARFFPTRQEDCLSLGAAQKPEEIVTTRLFPRLFARETSKSG